MVEVDLTPPTIMCVNDGDPDTVAQQQTCRNPIGYNRRVVASVEQGSGVVELCPLFFQQPRLSRKEACPTVDKVANRFELEDDGRDLGRNQYSVLVHEITHIYMGESGFAEDDEVYGLKGTVALNASASLRNAMNFAFYAAGEFSRDLLICLACAVAENIVSADYGVAVQAGCTDFPTLGPEPGG